MPANSPCGTCMASMNSRFQRTSSNRSGTPLPLSGRFSAPSPKLRSPLARLRSKRLRSVQVEMPLLTTYLP